MRTFIFTLMILGALPGLSACNKKPEHVPTAAEEKAQDEAARQQMAQGIADELEGSVNDWRAIKSAVKSRFAPEPQVVTVTNNPPPAQLEVPAAAQPESQVVSANFGTMSSTITVNGVTIKGGNSVVIRNGKVIVDGKDITPEGKEISITVNGNVSELKADACQTISVSGNTGNISTISGDIHAEGAINGSAQTTSGDITSGSISGNASSISGDVSCRR